MGPQFRRQTKLTFAQLDALAVAVLGLAAGYKLARGEEALDGGNPTGIATGLTTIVACSVALKRSSAPGLDVSFLTVDYGGAVPAGKIHVYAWKPTAAGDCTLIDSGATDPVSWIAVGT